MPDTAATPRDPPPRSPGSTGTGTPSDSSGPPSGFMTTAPAVEVPKGGGAVRGIGEKFSVSGATGTGALSIPLAAPPGRAGIDLTLAL
jgi:hypothetical protein